jgi:hypothetical protein
VRAGRIRRRGHTRCRRGCGREAPPALVARKLASFWRYLTAGPQQPDLDRFVVAATQFGFSERMASQVVATLLMQAGARLDELPQPTSTNWPRGSLRASRLARVGLERTPLAFLVTIRSPGSICSMGTCSTHKRRLYMTVMTRMLVRWRDVLFPAPWRSFGSKTTKTALAAVFGMVRRQGFEPRTR